MAYFSCYANEEDMLQPTLSCGNNEFDCDVTPTNDGTFYGSSFFNPSNYFYQEGLLELQAITPLPFMEEEEEEPIESEESCWFWQCESVFSWQGEYGSLGDGIISSNLEKTECSNPSEDQHDCRLAFQDENSAENYSASYDLWSFCDSLLRYGGEEGYSDCGQDESSIASFPEFAVYEGIFGYWPCLYRRQ